MSVPLTINGIIFNYPANFDTNWGIDATGWAQAVTSGMLQKSGGSFPLTADVNFGPTFGLIAPYYKSTTANIASTGSIRLAKTDILAWRNNANSANLPLGIDGSDNLTFNGSSLSFTGAVNPGLANQLAYYATSGNAISGLTAITASRALESDSNGLPVASPVSSTTLAFLDVTSSVQTQINNVVATANAALPEAGGTMSGAINMGSNKITNLANGTATSDATTVGQLAILIPPGIILMYGAASAPTGWLLCDGTSYPTATYPALFAAIGYVYGGAGANFNVPNFTNNIPVGPGGSIAPSVGSTSGATSVTPTSQAHTHTENLHTHSLGTTGTAGGQNYTGANRVGYNAGINDEIRVDATGGGETFTFVGRVTNNQTDTGMSSTTVIMNASSVVQPSLGVAFIIKT